MKILYVLSNVFDYAKLISGDAGPAFGADYGLRAVPLNSHEVEEADYLIFDNRFHAEELGDLAKYIKRSKAIILLKVVDPHYRNRDSSWYRFVAELVDHPKVHLALTYSETEFTALHLRAAERTQGVFMPYVYNEGEERPLEHAGRKHCVALSGSMNSSDYPLRTKMRLMSKAFPPFWWLVRHLDHPGYPDIGQPLTHQTIGSDYINWLAHHKFAFVCSSRYRLEFLKYREVAYAGCVPIGDLPYTFLDCPEDAHISFRSNILALTRQILAPDDTEATAESFRQFLRDRRGAAQMQKRLIHQLARLS